MVIIQITSGPYFRKPARSNKSKSPVIIKDIHSCPAGIDYTCIYGVLTVLGNLQVDACYRGIRINIAMCLLSGMVIPLFCTLDLPPFSPNSLSIFMYGG